MITAKVVGRATATLKDPSLEGRRMLLVQPVAPDGETPFGEPIIVVDAQHGAGIGEEVLVTSDGLTAREILNADKTPVRWTVAGICDN